MGNHALIFGASGISGWAVTNALLEGCPSPELFTKVSALTNRPLPTEVAQWPSSDKLQVVSGVDLLQQGGQIALENELRSRVTGIESVTHVYFFAYLKSADPDEVVRINVEMLKRAVGAVENLSKTLKFFVLTDHGGQSLQVYGIHMLNNFPIVPPLHENMPRIPEPYASQLFYYHNIDQLAQMCEGKNWTWCELRPDVIIGFVPNNNFSCLAQVLALYLSLYRAIEGAGAEVPFPGTAQSWTILSSDSGQDIIAKFAIFASLHPEKCGGGQAFNIADNHEPSSWSQRWPVICEYFGLKGVAPPPGASGPQPNDYIQAHLAHWKELEKEHGLQTGRVGNDRSSDILPYAVMTLFNFDRQMDLSKELNAWGAHAIETDPKGTWWTAFDRFRRAKIIP
ncbi:NAD(P)-binding Rossmann-fold containing protein [Mycena venus]|uniref:NAD(P)-binding Rossmann-fold containing protein n=1 Tax=Mycena venus TaxID=2733690 RepID=A0A8H6Z245_9AGAR|nr:NAD(P)-binding Rossmann-fold containing protein [Mycena venus]